MSATTTTPATTTTQTRAAMTPEETAAIVNKLGTPYASPEETTCETGDITASVTFLPLVNVARHNIHTDADPVLKAQSAWYVNVKLTVKADVSDDDAGKSIAAYLTRIRDAQTDARALPYLVTSYDGRSVTFYRAAMVMGAGTTRPRTTVGDELRTLFGGFTIGPVLSDAIKGEAVKPARDTDARIKAAVSVAVEETRKAEALKSAQMLALLTGCSVDDALAAANGDAAAAARVRAAMAPPTATTAPTGQGRNGGRNK